MTNGKTFELKHSLQNNSKLNDVIVDAIQDVKGMDITLIDLRAIGEASADFFIICHGNSTTQVAGIITNIERKVKELRNELPSHIEGKSNSQWMLIDYFSTVVHVFLRESRRFYNLEGLWGDAPTTQYEKIV